jgi:lupus La protein
MATTGDQNIEINIVKIEEPVLNPQEPPKELTEKDFGKLAQQLDFYFSDSNYPKDKFILELANADGGWVPIDVFVKFNKIKRLTNDTSVVEKCFRNCKLVEVSEDGKKVKRLAPLLDPEVLEKRTVHASGFSTAKFTKKQNIEKTFTVFGKVMSVWNINERINKKKKRGVYIEFDSEESANKAISAGVFTFKDDEKEYSIKIISKKDHLILQEEQQKNYDKHNNKGRRNNKRKREDGDDADDTEPNKSYNHGVLLKLQNYTDIVLPEEKFHQTRDFLKQTFSEYGKVCYVDASNEGYCIIRFEETASAKNALDALTINKKKIREKEINAVLLEGDEEKKYWEDNIFNKPQNNNQHKRKKKKY